MGGEKEEERKETLMSQCREGPATRARSNKAGLTGPDNAPRPKTVGAEGNAGSCGVRGLEYGLRVFQKGSRGNRKQADAGALTNIRHLERAGLWKGNGLREA